MFIPSRVSLKTAVSTYVREASTWHFRRTEERKEKKEKKKPLAK
jgi:hypothetical protein